MAPFEPKTDSKEFEVLIGGQGSTGPGGSTDLTDITIRLWHPEKPPAANPPTWRTESVLVYMVADLVTASHGRIDESTPAMMAHFDTSGQALVAAKRIQTAILEFLACRPSDSFAAAVLIHSPSNTSGGISATAALGALRLAEPGQILLSEETARRLRDLPGIELRSVPALTTGGDEQRGLSELVWTSPERLAPMQRQAAIDRHREESPAMGATMIVNAPFGNARPDSGKTGQTSLGATGSAPAQKTATGQKPSSDHMADLAAGADASPQAAPDEEQAPFLTRTRLIFGAVAVVLVSVLVWEFYPSAEKPKLHPIVNPASSTQPTTTNTTGQTGETSTSGTTQQPGGQQTGDTQSSTADSAPNQVTHDKATPDKTAKDKRSRDKQKKDQQQEEQPPPPPQEVEGMTKKDIPYLLKKAQTDFGAGHYEDARHEFTVVLKLQPDNVAAIEGMHRVRIVMGDK